MRYLCIFLCLFTGCKTWEMTLGLGLLGGLAQAVTGFEAQKRGRSYVAPAVPAYPSSSEVHPVYLAKEVSLSPKEVYLIQTRDGTYYILEPELTCNWCIRKIGTWLNLQVTNPAWGTALLISKDGDTVKCTIKSTRP